MQVRRTVPRIVARLGLALLYVWLVREAYLFMYADSCLDGGGALDSVSGLCSGARPGEGGDIGVRAPLIFWVALLGLPAAAVWGTCAVLMAALRLSTAGGENTVS